MKYIKPPLTFEQQADHLATRGLAIPDKAAKVATTRTLWVPAINNHGGFGRWAFIEVADPWDAKNAIRTSLQKGTTS